MDGPSIEEQLTEAFDNILAKSAKTRIAAFEALRKGLGERYMIDFVLGRKITILDALSRCIRRSKGQDLGLSANIVAIVCATIGPDPETDPIFSEIISQLSASLADQAVLTEVRSRCARSISLCAFIMGTNGYHEQIMDRLCTIFMASCAKGDGTMPCPSEQVASLHSSALQSWTLLITAIENSNPQAALEIIDCYMDKIAELLDSQNLDVKSSSGEALAVMCEIIKTHNNDVTPSDFDELCDRLRDVMTDTQKFRGKRDNRQQRSNFREILAAIENDDCPSLVVKFGRERLVLETWSKRRQYDVFCDLFGTGINHHLSENEVVRDIFGLGDVIVHLDLPRIKRSENAYENSVADKARSKNMRRLRDKRADVIS